VRHAVGFAEDDGRQAVGVQLAAPLSQVAGGEAAVVFRLQWLVRNTSRGGRPPGIFLAVRLPRAEKRQQSHCRRARVAVGEIAGVSAAAVAGAKAMVEIPAAVGQLVGGEPLEGAGDGSSLAGVAPRSLPSCARPFFASSNEAGAGRALDGCSQVALGNVSFPTG